MKISTGIIIFFIGFMLIGLACSQKAKEKQLSNGEQFPTKQFSLKAGTLIEKQFIDI